MWGTRISGFMKADTVDYDKLEEIFNADASYISSVYLPRSDNCYSGLHAEVTSAPVYHLPVVSETNIINSMKSLRNKETSGPGSIPSFFVKDCSAVLG